MTESELYRQQLSELGLCGGDVVMVHSSMKAMGTKRTPEEIIGDIEAVIGEEGTLLMPALTYENGTVFDSEKSEPCVGLMAKPFGVCRTSFAVSTLPIPSVRGAGLRILLQRGTLWTTLPWACIRRLCFCPAIRERYFLSGKSLMRVLLCTELRRSLSRPISVRQRDTTPSTVKNAPLGAGRFRLGSEFQRIEWILEEPDIRRGQLGGAKAYLIDSRALLAAALFKMRADPYCFVTDISPWI